ncbi:glycosyltransferase family 2 protein [Prauserella halophila]
MPGSSWSNPAVSEGPDDTCPSVSVVIPTRDRPELVTRAARAVLAQEYAGDIECIVVFDQTEPHPLPLDNGSHPGRRIVLRRNERTSGLAGARNTGILTATGEIVGHCDDDDEWLPGKLARQLERWHAEPAAPAVATGLVIRNDTGEHRRLAPERATFADFLASRIMEIHSSSLLVHRADLLGRIGLVDEGLPASYGEDHEWLLRATRHGDVVSVPEPCVRINWNRPSFYMGKWQAMVDGLTYMLDRVPEFADNPRGLARMEGQIAFACAAMGRRRAAVRWALRTLRHDPRQVRGLGALAVAARVVKADRLVRLVQSRGRGL